MYYETRIYKPEQVTGSLEAAERLKSGKIYAYEALTYKTPKGDVFIVDDSHCDRPFLEVAVILNNGVGMRQIESITAGWINTAPELAKYFDDAISEPCDMGKASLNLNHADVNETGNFECGCCGSYFKGNVKYQLQFGQDNGYGICKSCEKYYL